jgi:hypothetical protein
VVKLLAEAQLRRAALVEGEVDHDSLGPETSERFMQCGGAAAALKDEVGAPVARSVDPALLAPAPRLAVALIDHLDAESGRGGQTLRVGIGERG